MQDYYFVYTECKPKRDALFLAEKQILVHEGEIEERKGQLGKLQVKLEELRDTYKEKEVSVRRLQGEIDECNIQKTRAAKLLNSLQGEKQKWSVLNRVVQEKYDTLEGDCLLAAGLIIYLS
jgi:dynein heavy chain, axonemal